MAGEPTNLLAGFAGVAEGLVKGLEIRDRKKQEKKQEAMQQAQLKASQLQQDFDNKYRERELKFKEDQAKERAAKEAADEKLKADNLSLRQKIAETTDATKRWGLALQLGSKTGESPEQIMQQASYYAGQPQQAAGQPQQAPTAAQGLPQALSSLTGQPSPVQTPQIPLPGGMQGTPPIAPQQGGFDPSSKFGAGSQLGGQAAARQAQVSKIQTDAELAKMREGLIKAQTDTLKQTLTGKVDSLRMKNILAGTENAYKMIQADKAKASIELIIAETTLKHAQQHGEEARTALTKTRDSLMAEEKNNPQGSTKYMKWAASATRGLDVHMNSIRNEQVKLITEIDDARTKVAGWKAFLNEPEPKKPEQNATPAELKNYTETMVARKQMQAKVPEVETKIAHMEELNRQYEADKAQTQADVMRVGYHVVKKDGSPDNKATKAAQVAAQKEAEAKKKEADAKPKVPNPKGPMPVKDIKHASEDELFNMLRP